MIAFFIGVAAAQGLGREGYVLPEPAALAAIDASATKFDEPSSPTDFALAAGSFFAADGTPKAGGVAEVSARALGLTRKVTASRYADDAALRFLSRAALSAATAQEGKDLRMGLGLRLVFFDGADPLLEPAYKLAAEAARAKCEAIRQEQSDTALDRYAKCIEKAYAAEAVGLGKSRWNAPGLSLSTALSFRSPDGSLRQSGAEAASAWVSYAHPLGEEGQGGVALAYSEGIGAAPREVGLTALGRLGLGRARLRAEPGLILTVTDDPPTLRIPLVLGGELGFGEDTWVSTRFGLVVDPDQDALSLLSSATFRWGQGSTPSFKPE